MVGVLAVGVVIGAVCIRPFFYRGARQGARQGTRQLAVGVLAVGAVCGSLCRAALKRPCVTEVLCRMCALKKEFVRVALAPCRG